MNRITKSKGFTLIELMVVIVIIGVLAAIAIPKFMDASTKAKFGEMPVIMASYDHAQLARLAETASLAAQFSDLIMDDPTGSKWFMYTYFVPGATNSSTYNGSIKAGITLSGLTNASGSATSIITTAGTPAHTTTNTALNKYLASFN
jgi:type IV pilus assembly protein PilA